MLCAWDVVKDPQVMIKADQDVTLFNYRTQLRNSAYSIPFTSSTLGLWFAPIFEPP
jgi:hypothetical protein